MPLVRIVHWRPAESGRLVAMCQSSGWKTDYHGEAAGPAITRGIREKMPDAVVIDLSRLPSHGREVAVWMRGNRRTRHIPIVFANGDLLKIAAIKELLPDAIYTTTTDVPEVLRSLGNTPVQADPVAPLPMMDRYATRTIAEKLGIGRASTVGVMDAPRDYALIIGDLPGEVSVVEDPNAVQQVTLWFVQAMDDLGHSLRRMRAMADKTKLWIVWKKGSRNGVTQNGIREAAIDAGLVDYKICALGESWSGILFARKKK